MTEDWHFNDDTIYDCIILFKHIDQSDISWRHIRNNNDVYILWWVLSKYCLYIKKYNLKLIYRNINYPVYLIMYSILKCNIFKCNFLGFLKKNISLLIDIWCFHWHSNPGISSFNIMLILKRRYKAHNDSSFYTKQHFPWKEDKSTLIWDHTVVQW